MTKKEKELLQARIEWEGTDYALAEFSNWETIKDETFHKFLSAYREARSTLMEYSEEEGLDV